MRIIEKLSHKSIGFLHLAVFVQILSVFAKTFWLYGKRWQTAQLIMTP